MNIRERVIQDVGFRQEEEAVWVLSYVLFYPPEHWFGA
jgi:hypothetical protein